MTVARMRVCLVLSQSSALGSLPGALNESRRSLKRSEINRVLNKSSHTLSELIACARNMLYNNKIRSMPFPRYCIKKKSDNYI